MKRVSLTAMLVVAVLALASTAALAQSGSLVSAGLTMHDNESHYYFYGEVAISPTLVGSFEYTDGHPLKVGVWHGIGQGFYGELALATEDTKESIQVGVWRDFPLSDSIKATGWIGVQSDLSASGISAAGGVELAVPLANSIVLFAGADTTLLKSPSQTSTWVGVGLRF